MRLQKNKELEKTLTKLELSYDRFNDVVVDELLKSNIIEDLEENYGYLLFDILEECISKEDIINILKEINIRLNTTKVKAGHLYELTIIGDYECPYCGGRLERTPLTTRVLEGDGYNNPIEEIAIEEDVKCLVCDYQFSTEKNY